MQIAAAVDNERLNINGSEEQVEQEDIKYDKNKTNETRKGSGGGYVQSYKEEYNEDIKTYGETITIMIPGR